MIPVDVTEIKACQSLFLDLDPPSLYVDKAALSTPYTDILVLNHQEKSNRALMIQLISLPT